MVREIRLIRRCDLKDAIVQVLHPLSRALPLACVETLLENDAFPIYESRLWTFRWRLSGRPGFVKCGGRGYECGVASHVRCPSQKDVQTGGWVVGERHVTGPVERDVSGIRKRPLRPACL